MLRTERTGIIEQQGAVVLALAVLWGCGADAKQAAGDGALTGDASPNLNGIFRLSQQSVKYSGCQGMPDASATGTDATTTGKQALLSLIPPYIKIAVAPDGATVRTYKCAGDRDPSCETTELSASLGQSARTVFTSESVSRQLTLPTELQNMGISCSLVLDAQSSLSFVNSNDAVCLWEITGRAVEAKHLVDCGQIFPEWTDFCKETVTVTATRVAP